MGYYETSLIPLDQDLRQRCTACAALEDIPSPESWVWEHIWEYAAAPGWGDAWSSALAADNPSPGKDPGVITDGMILSQTQELYQAEQEVPA